MNKSSEEKQTGAILIFTEEHQGKSKCKEPPMAGAKCFMEGRGEDEDRDRSQRGQLHRSQ